MREDVAGASARPGGTGSALAVAVGLLTLRRSAMSPQPSRAAVLDGADPRDVAEYLEVICAGMLSALPDGGEALLRHLGLVALEWSGGDAG